MLAQADTTVISILAGAVVTLVGAIVGGGRFLLVKLFGNKDNGGGIAGKLVTAIQENTASTRALREDVQAQTQEIRELNSTQKLVLDQMRDREVRNTKGE